MPRYFMVLAYRGANFHGWQMQPNACSVQQTVEEALGTLLRTETKITGAGRTDTGVNARCMVAHFDTADSLTAIEGVVNSLNSMLGPDIAVYGLIPVSENAHARFDASMRTYRYYAIEYKSPFLNTLAWRASNGIDFEAMNQAAQMLLEVDDFTSFAKLHTDNKTNICNVSHAQWHRAGNGIWYFEITADRFLRNMVRAVVGTLVDVGRGKVSLDGFKAIIAACDRCCAGTSMPAHALYLWSVGYPYCNPEQFLK